MYRVYSENGHVTVVQLRIRKNLVFWLKIASEDTIKRFFILYALQACSISFFLKKLDTNRKFRSLTKFCIGLISKTLKQQILRTNGSYIFFNQYFATKSRKLAISIEIALEGFNNRFFELLDLQAYRVNQFLKKLDVCYKFRLPTKL